MLGYLIGVQRCSLRVGIQPHTCGSAVTYNDQEMRMSLNDMAELARDRNTELQDIHRAIQESSKKQEERQQDDQDRNCLEDLRLSDPRDDKRRIKDTKGGLFRGASSWILDHDDFQRWRDDDEARVLWVKGDPGKGKTMLVMSIVEDLERQLQCPSGQPTGTVLVKRLITKPLNSNNPSGSGYVYAYTVQGNPQYVKIGCTTDTVEERLKEWGFDCNRAPTVLYPMASSTVARVSNVRRVEALWHAELSHRRIRIDCKGCLKPHLEWFEVSAADAIAVIQKWSKWMATEPYQFSVEKWELKPAGQKRIREIGCFMKEISKV